MYKNIKTAMIYNVCKCDTEMHKDIDSYLFRQESGIFYPFLFINVYYLNLPKYCDFPYIYF